MGQEHFDIFEKKYGRAWKPFKIHNYSAFESLVGVF